MGVEIFPEFKPSVRGAKFNADGKLLARVFEQLDRIAASHGLQKFSAFGDNREIPDDFEGDPDELDELLGPCDVWYPVKDGLKTIEGLIECIKTDPKTARKVKEPQGVVEALEELARCLHVAAKKNAKFRLEMA